MNLATPESAAPIPVTVLNRFITETPRSPSEITVNAENLGAKMWPEMLAGTQSDGIERGLIVFQTPITKKFVTSRISKGDTSHVGPSLSDIGLRKMFFPVVAKVHTHPTIPEDAHLITTPPLDGDLQLFSRETYSTMVVLDRSGVHLLIRTRELTQWDSPPPIDLIRGIIDEVHRKDGLTTDVQKMLNSRLSPYGIEYFYTPNLTPAANGTITFRKP